MGFLTGIPDSALVYVDSCVLIYSVEKVRPYWPGLRELWADAVGGHVKLCVSELALAEVLVGPYKTSDHLIERAFEDLIAYDVHCLPITQSILRSAARLRAQTNLRTPDAIHAATALAEGCELFVTNDAGFKRVPGLNVALLSDLVAP